MGTDRREFLLLAGALIAGCDREPNTSGVPRTNLSATKPTNGGGSGRVADAGPVQEFSTDGVYDATRDSGFFLIRRAGKLIALSSICTHKGCKVRAQPDESFICKCHGSTFDREGRVTKPPAQRDLPRFAVRLDDQDHVLVDLDQRVERPQI